MDADTERLIPFLRFVRFGVLIVCTLPDILFDLLRDLLLDLLFDLLRFLVIFTRRSTRAGIGARTFSSIGMTEGAA